MSDSRGLVGVAARGQRRHVAERAPEDPHGVEQVDAREFGAFLRGLRRVRGLTQEQLAERSGLAADTIRRLEHATFSPSLVTLTKVCRGLELERSTLFEAFELRERSAAEREVLDLLSTRSDADVELGLAMLRTIFDQLDRSRGPAPVRVGLFALASGDDEAEG